MAPTQSGIWTPDLLSWAVPSTAVLQPMTNYCQTIRAISSVLTMRWSLSSSTCTIKVYHWCVFELSNHASNQNTDKSLDRRRYFGGIEATLCHFHLFWWDWDQRTLAKRFSNESILIKDNKRYKAYFIVSSSSEQYRLGIARVESLSRPSSEKEEMI